MGPAPGETLARLAKDVEKAADMGRRARKLLMARAGDANALIEAIVAAADICSSHPAPGGTF